MPARLLSCLALVGLVALPAPTPLKAAESATPSLVVRIKSIDTLIADIKTLATLGGAEEQAKQIDGILKAKIGAKGFEGIDPKRPLGMYGTLTGNLIDASAVVLVPIADEKTFLDLLERLNVNVEKGKDGVYTVATGLPIPVYFRFANKYAYVTARDKGALEKDRLLDPAKVLPTGGTGTLSAMVRIDQIPDEIKQIALGQLELRLADAQDKEVPGETANQKQLKIQVLKDLSRRISSVVKDGNVLSVQLDLDRQTNELVFDVTLTGKNGTKLSTDIAEFGQTKSLFAGTQGSISAMHGLLHWVLPEEVRKTLDPVIDEGIRKALDKESDAAKRAGAEKLLRALTPSLKSGDLDTAFTLRGPGANGKYGLVLGIKVKDGQAIEQTARDLIKSLPEGDREKIKLDAETIGDIKVHRADVHKDFDKKTKDLFGENPLYMAFRPDAWFFAFGEGGLEILKETVATQPKAGPQILFEMSLARMAPIMAKETKNAVKFAEDAFGQGSDKDKLRFTVEGGKSLHARFVMKTEVVKFFSQVAQSKKSDE
jgi:hypothetical protein